MALGFLRADAPGALGLWGMGGVGKTTVLKHVNNSLAKDPLGFDRVVFLVASRGCGVGKIQELLKDKLGLNNIDQIFGYLSSKSFVLMLDDLWDPLDLEEAGIPLPLGAKRKLILTTREQQVCASMGALARRVERLDREAARRLFRDKVGEEAINSHHPIQQLADEVADECDGLPLALITIGSAMAGTQNVQVWQNCINQLRRSRPSKVPGMEPPEIPGTAGPLRRLKFSYDHLNDPMKQQCFLHCALWPEDHEIPADHLVECWMGHGLLGDGSDEIREVYDQGYAIIDALQKACLLEPAVPGIWDLKKGKVKLHDVIRDMALWIARDCGEEERKWIVIASGEQLTHDARVWSEVHKLSVMDTSKGFPSGLRCPKLGTLFLDRTFSHLSGIMWEYFSELKYLSLTGYRLPEEFPIEMCSLIKLEYLNISYTGVRSLPTELKHLSNLKYLIARNTTISHLPHDLLASLFSLLHLDLLPGKTSASQSSIIDDLNLVNGHLMALAISVSTVTDMEKLARLENMRVRRLLMRSMEGIASLPLLSGGVLGRRHMHSNLRYLRISECAPTFEVLVFDEECLLSDLGELRLQSLPGLKEVIWKGVVPQNVLPNLCMLSIVDCHLLKHVTWIADLPLLELLNLDRCKNMINLIQAGAVGRAESYGLSFPKLRSLCMRDLPNLESICDSVLACPSVEFLEVRYCARLKKLPFQSRLSLRNIKRIICGDEWWNSLEMDDETRTFLQPFSSNWGKHMATAS